jgi:hypothetical protein
MSEDSMIEPDRSASREAGRKRDVAQAQTVLRGMERPTSEIYALAERLKDNNEFGYVRKLRAHPKHRRLRCLTNSAGKVAQRHALCTYKDPDLPASDSLRRALEILDDADKIRLTRSEKQESLGLRGAIYKGLWQVEGQQAIDAYLKGFEADGRDAYPRINAVTLMELKDPPDPRRERLLPVVAYAVDRRIAQGQPDYWDHATRLELAVLAKKEPDASGALGDALARIRERWEPETTARNLRLIREARERRGQAVGWATTIEQELELKAAG